MQPAVAHAVPEVQAVAKYTSPHQGGNGAVRDIIEYILKAQGLWEGLIAAYMKPERFNINQ